MSDIEKLIYMRAINDARELLIADGKKAYGDGDLKSAFLIATCSGRIAELLKDREVEHAD